MSDESHSGTASIKAHVEALLNEQGFREIESDEDGDLRFRAEGRTLVMIFHERDPGYLRLALPNFWPVENDGERLKAFEIANRIARDNKCVKVVLTRSDNVWVVAEWLTTGPQAVTGPLLLRLTEILLASAGEFKRDMQAP